MIDKIRWWHILLLFASFKIIIHLTTNTLWSLHRDALLYLALGRHLDWGYASVPPSIAMVSWFADRILGGSIFAIRIIPTIISTLTVVITGLMAWEFSSAMGSKQRGKFSIFLVGIAGITSGAYLRPGMMLQPVVFDIFYWTLLCWLVLKFINSENNKWLIIIGCTMGLSLLNKYSIAFLIVGFIPLLVFTPQRKLWRKKAFYISLLIALAIFSPNLIWQFQHELPVVRHMQELAATQFVNVTISGFILDQFLFFLTAVPLWVLGIYFLLLHRDAKKWRGFAWMYFTVVILMLILKGKSYYTIGAYPVLIAAGAAYLEKITVNSQWIPFSLSALMLAIAVPRFPVVIPIYSPGKVADYFEKRMDSPIIQSALRWEDGRQHTLPQDFADMLGWEEIAELAGEAWSSVSDKDNAAIYAENYGLAGAIEHFGKKYRVPQVLSFSDNYRYWLPDSLPSDFETLIYVNDELGDDMPGFFNQITEVGRLNMPLSRQDGTLVFLCKGPTPAFFERIGGAIRRAKNEEVID